MCQWLRSPYTVCIREFFVTLADRMLLGLQLKKDRKGTIHSFFDFSSHEVTQGCSKYVSRCVESSLIYSHSCCCSVHIFTSLSKVIYFSPNWKCPMTVQECLVIFGPPCIRVLRRYRKEREREMNAELWVSEILQIKLQIIPRFRHKTKTQSEQM